MFLLNGRRMTGPVGCYACRHSSRFDYSVLDARSKSVGAAIRCLAVVRDGGVVWLSREGSGTEEDVQPEGNPPVTFRIQLMQRCPTSGSRYINGQAPAIT